MFVKLGCQHNYHIKEKAQVRTFSMIVKTLPIVQLKLYLRAFDMESSAESVLKSGLGFRIWM